MPVRLQAPLGQEFGFAFFFRDQPYDILVQPGWYQILLDIGNETVLVFLFYQVGEIVACGWHLVSRYLG